VSFESTIVAVMKAWERGEQKIRVIVALSIALVGVAMGLVATGYITGNRDVFEMIAAIVGVLAAGLTFIVKGYQEFLEDKSVRAKIKTVEAQILENPEKPQLAWELAQTKLESYLNRNLGQVRSVFWLTVIVMVIGFAFILFGLLRAFDAPDKLPVAIIASASGVLVSFIGGSFLLVYRSTLAQSKDYVSVLERINAVGMAIQVLETIPQEAADLKNTTTAEVAKQLLRLYSTTTLPAEPRKKKGG
jgi:hypothetical protein